MSRGRPRDTIRAKDPVIRRLLEAVDASPMSDMAILQRAGCAGDALYRLRSGSRMGRLSTVTSIAGAVGLRLELVKDDG